MSSLNLIFSENVAVAETNIPVFSEVQPALCVVRIISGHLSF